MTSRHGVGLVVVIVFLAACMSNCASPGSQEPAGSPEYVADMSAIESDLEGQIDEKVSRQWETRVVGTRVECPPQVDWQVGESFRCDVTVPGSPPGYAKVSMESDDGKYSWYISNQ